MHARRNTPFLSAVSQASAGDPHPFAVTTVTPSPRHSPSVKYIFFPVWVSVGAAGDGAFFSAGAELIEAATKRIATKIRKVIVTSCDVAANNPVSLFARRNADPI